MTINKNSVVKLNYNLMDNNNNIIDSSDINGSLVYIQGYGMMMPGIEKIVEGKDKGFTYEGEISPEDGYGIYKSENVMPVPTSQFANIIDQVEEGKHYNFDVGGGQTQLLKVVKIDDDYVTVDANHPYAGETIKVSLEVEDSREATEDELNSLQGGHSCGCGSKKSGGCCSSGDSDHSCGCSSGEKSHGGGCGCSSGDSAHSCGCSH